MIKVVGIGRVSVGAAGGFGAVAVTSVEEVCSGGARVPSQS